MLYFGRVQSDLLQSTGPRPDLTNPSRAQPAAPNVAPRCDSGKQLGADMTAYGPRGVSRIGLSLAVATGLLIGSGIINESRAADGDASTGAAQGSQYLDRVESPVFETVGTHQEITKRAITCIAQIVKPGLVNAPTIVSSDIKSGVIVANNSFKFSYGLLETTARTTLTFQAKDGRFRIVHASIEQLSDARGWIGIGTWRFSGGDAAKEAIEAISQSLATCVKSNPTANDNW